MEYLLVDYPNLNEKKAAFKFPSVASEILASPNEKILEYFSIEDGEGRLRNFERLFDPFVDLKHNLRIEEVNFTRVGYIQKILTSLLNAKPQLFEEYVLKHRILIKSMIRHAYAKSVSVLLLNFIILAPAISPNNASQQVVTANNQADPNAKSAESTHADLLKSTLKDRLMFFSEIIQECIASISSEDHIELHANFAFIIMSILSKDFSEQADFTKTFVDHLDEVIEAFIESYGSPNNNKLGNIFLVFLESFLKDAEKNNTSNFDLKKLEAYMRSYYKLIITASDKIEDADGKPRRRTSSFPVELPKANLKIYKVLEAILMTTKFYLGKPEFDQSVFINNDFEKCVFHLLIEFPFNNILHNQIKKYLLNIVESSNQALLRKYFSDNSEFYSFLKHVVEHKHLISYSAKKVRVGFVGQVVIVTTALLKNTELSNSLDKSKLIRP